MTMNLKTTCPHCKQDPWWREVPNGKLFACGCFFSASIDDLATAGPIERITVGRRGPAIRQVDWSGAMGPVTTRTIDLSDQQDGETQ